jgi:hypothetical protein
VPRRELPCGVEELPLLKASPAQPSLFPDDLL